MVPGQLGLGIQRHQHFALRFLIDSIKKHEFCVSYSEVIKYEDCAAVHQGTKISGVSESSSAKPTHFMYHVADNADRSSRTLEGRNTVHGMGIIYSVTPEVSSSFTISRLEDLSTEDGPVIKVLDFQSRGPRVQNHWVAPRSTQSFILPTLIK